MNSSVELSIAFYSYDIDIGLFKSDTQYKGAFRLLALDHLLELFNFFFTAFNKGYYRLNVSLHTIKGSKAADTKVHGIVKKKKSIASFNQKLLYES